MEPPARDSIKRMSPTLWTLGSSMICVKIGVGQAQPLNTIASWKDGDSDFHLIPRDEGLLVGLGEGDSAIDRIQECGTGGSVFSIGSEAICKAKSWYEGRQLEGATIKFVREQFPSVPLPEVLYSWTNPAMHRTFLITRRVHARTLNTAWPDLSASQRKSIAIEVAEHCASLATKTSSTYESDSGCGVLEYWLMKRVPTCVPTWRITTLGPLTHSELKIYLSSMSKEDIPFFGDALVFHHADLGPTNILVSDDGNNIAAIIDWEVAGYFPDFWVATKPATVRAFQLDEAIVGPQAVDEWPSLFVEALVSKGFSCQKSVYQAWKSGWI
jgi:hypothetical protein